MPQPPPRAAAQCTGAAPAADIERRFGGVTRLLGAPAHARLRAARIAVVGIGGVGSWAAEALARSGVECITLIDLDHVAESNANRQIQALGDEFGKAKVTAMAQRIEAINPQARVTCIEEFVTEDNVSELIRDLDLVLDCIDQVSAKAALIAHARATGVRVVTCGAAGGRTDPTRIRCDDLARALGDPLLAKVRYRLRRRYGFARETPKRRPPFGVDAVFSDEPVRRPQLSAAPRPPSSTPLPQGEGLGGRAKASTPLPQGQGPGERLQSGLACAGYGSSVMVTAPLGFAAAARAVQRIIQA
jgi:tRNA A37 threonylcarbamoyladenosine dehydratase